jgi:hypothetical protein
MLIRQAHYPSGDGFKPSSGTRHVADPAPSEIGERAPDAVHGLDQIVRWVLHLLYPSSRSRSPVWASSSASMSSAAEDAVDLIVDGGLVVGPKLSHEGDRG